MKTQKLGIALIFSTFIFAGCNGGSGSPASGSGSPAAITLGGGVGDPTDTTVSPSAVSSAPAFDIEA